MTPARTNQNWLPSIFNEFLDNNWLAERRNATAPAVNIIEDEDEYKVEVAAPGMTREDFKVQISVDRYSRIIIAGRHKIQSRPESLLLPDNIEREKISARVENGVMTIDIPKKKVEELAAATRQIEVK